MYKVNGLIIEIKRYGGKMRGKKYENQKMKRKKQMREREIEREQWVLCWNGVGRW